MMNRELLIKGTTTFLYDNYRDIFDLWADAVNYDMEACFIADCINEGCYKDNIEEGKKKIKEFDALSKKFRKEYETAAKLVLV